MSHIDGETSTWLIGKNVFFNYPGLQFPLASPSIQPCPVVGDSAAFFAQNEYAKDWEYSTRKLRGTIKRLPSKLLRTMRSKYESYFTGALLVRVLRKTRIACDENRIRSTVETTLLIVSMGTSVRPRRGCNVEERIDERS